MRTNSMALVRCLFIAALVSGALGLSPSSASAQVGVGARLAWVTPDSNVAADRVRFIGGQVRLLSSRWGLEVALDHHADEFPAVNQKVTETPIQASVLLRLGAGKVKPFLLGGPGWYRRKASLLDAPGSTSVTSTEFGWHGGVGLEVLAGRHVGVHGDYRYTFLDFNGTADKKDEGLLARFLPGHRGSMWTLGATFYF